MIKRKYQICTRCVMDTSDPAIQFDSNGLCNHCRQYEARAKEKVMTGEAGEKKLRAIAEEIKRVGKGKPYDSLIGLSGGIDSSFAAYQAKSLGLRTLAVHLDNGWDSEVAVRNIENIVRKLDFELYTHVIDWEEFKDLQIAFLKASVVDIEMLTDHAILAAIYNMANEKGIKYILSGTNAVTEGILPEAWIHRKTDLLNLKSIHKRYGKVKLKTYPQMGVFKWLYYHKRMQFVELLNYVDYNKKQARELLQSEFDWQDYGGKHYESIFTRFYQAYILPTKFGIDKRKAHLSTLICSGQITREKALKELEKPLYEKEELERDRGYVLKKLGLSEKEFEDLMRLSIKKHQEFATEDWIYALLKRLKNLYLALLGKA